MAQFDESKVINALHADKAVIGKKYWCSDNIFVLKRKVENNEHGSILKKIDSPYFKMGGNESNYYLLYPYEEPPKQRMTNIQFIEWLAKGNGVYKNMSGYVHCSFAEMTESLDDEVNMFYLIRPFGQTEWIEPTVDIYERDCKTPKIYVDKGF